MAVIETTEGQVLRLGDVDLAHALREGERYLAPEWRADAARSHDQCDSSPSHPHRGVGSPDGTAVSRSG